MKKHHKHLSKNKREFLNRAGYTNHHHLVPKSRGGSYACSNLFRWDERRHAAFHLLFGNMTFPEAARLLMRAWNMKKHTEEVL